VHIIEIIDGAGGMIPQERLMSVLVLLSALKKI